eukprot:TRINITY_DN65605_c0_g1_i1.p1 TRINITY_DN65605_c0_g1~~TRINITY_DN65605_c0_g1_i1.p1  ORF type:complete len:691 (-),score=158.01 TRINITY_DN65605_c0_g1_i1:147-2219(-)
MEPDPLGPTPPFADVDDDKADTKTSAAGQAASGSLLRKLQQRLPGLWHERAVGGPTRLYTVCVVEDHFVCIRKLQFAEEPAELRTFHFYLDAASEQLLWTDGQRYSCDAAELVRSDFQQILWYDVVRQTYCWSWARPEDGSEVLANEGSSATVGSGKAPKPRGPKTDKRKLASNAKEALAGSGLGASRGGPSTSAAQTPGFAGEQTMVRRQRPAADRLSGICLRHNPAQGHECGHWWCERMHLDTHLDPVQSATFHEALRHWRRAKGYQYQPDGGGPPAEEGLQPPRNLGAAMREPAHAAGSSSTPIGAMPERVPQQESSSSSSWPARSQVRREDEEAGVRMPIGPGGPSWQQPPRGVHRITPGEFDGTGHEISKEEVCKLIEDRVAGVVSHGLEGDAHVLLGRRLDSAYDPVDYSIVVLCTHSLGRQYAEQFQSGESTGLTWAALREAHRYYEDRGIKTYAVTGASHTWSWQAPPPRELANCIVSLPERLHGVKGSLATLMMTLSMALHCPYVDSRQYTRMDISSWMPFLTEWMAKKGTSRRVPFIFHDRTGQFLPLRPPPRAPMPLPQPEAEPAEPAEPAMNAVITASTSEAATPDSCMTADDVPAMCTSSSNSNKIRFVSRAYADELNKAAWEQRKTEKQQVAEEVHRQDERLQVQTSRTEEWLNERRSMEPELQSQALTRLLAADV